MHARTRLLFTAAAAALVTSCTSPAPLPTMTVEEHRQDVEQWQTARVARLKADDGWLTLVGLYWIEDGVSKVGSDPSSDVVLPASAPKETGTVVLEKGKARFVPAPGVDLQETTLKHDEEPDYPVIKIGSVSFYLILRGDRYGIRVKDTESEARKHFAGLEWYPADPGWRVEAQLIPDPHTVTFDTLAGVTEIDQSPGYFEFEHNGDKFKMDAVIEGDELFWVFRDQTSGKTTYDAARFIYSPLPDKDGRVFVDFNRAYNPPCVFTDFATCPLPPPENRMKVAVEVGEKKYAGHL